MSRQSKEMLVIPLKYTQKSFVNPPSPGGTYIVHKKPIFLSTPGLQGLMDVELDVYIGTKILNMFVCKYWSLFSFIYSDS